MSMRKKKDEGKVLTFVDMSALSYLSKSVSNSDAFKKINHAHKQVVIPENTKAAIVEDVSEEDYNSEDEDAANEEDKAGEEKDLTVQEVVNEFIDQMLNVIFEADDPNHVYKYDIIDN